jgi:hypothetical protein
MLREEAGELVATFDEQPKETLQENGSLAESSEVGTSVVSATVDEAVPANAGTRPTVSIHVQVRCTADEIEELAPRLKALIRELSTED